MSNKLTKMAREILEMEEDLPIRFDYRKERNVSIDDFEMITFTQIWGSTALGFGGIGGQAMTEANTYVFIPVSCHQKCFVYFAGRFAYTADFCEAFKEDVRKNRMEPVSNAGKYRVEEK